MTLATGSTLVRFGSVALLVVFDQWSKVVVWQWLEASPDGRSVSRRLAGEWLSFCSSCNGGAAFGQFTQFPYVLVIGRALAVLFLGWLLLRAGSRPRLPLFAMTLVLAGALGNLLDNLTTGCSVSGHPFLGVRDFVDVYFRPLLGIDYHFPAFNVADSCITVGACAWILASFLHRPPAATEATNPETKQPETTSTTQPPAAQ